MSGRHSRRGRKIGHRDKQEHLTQRKPRHATVGSANGRLRPMCKQRIKRIRCERDLEVGVSSPLHTFHLPSSRRHDDEFGQNAAKLRELGF